METREAVERMNFYAAKSRKFVFAFDFEKHEALFLSDDMDNKQLLFEIKGRGNAPCSSSYAECLRAKADLEIKYCDQKHYYEAFAKVQGGLQRGDSFLCNLTTKTKYNSIFRWKNSSIAAMLPTSCAFQTGLYASLPRVLSAQRTI